MTSPLDISEQEIRERCAPLLSAAIDEAARLHHNFIGTEHLYNALSKIEGGVTQRLLLAAGLDPRSTRNEIRREAGPGEDEPEEEPPFSPRAYRILAMAVYHADDCGDDRVQETHMLLAILQEGEGIAVRKLMALGVEAETWIELLFEEIKRKDGTSQVNRVDAAENVEAENPARPPTPLLDKYGRDLTELARQGKISQAIGREREIRAVARTLTRSKKNNPLLVGDAGVGKTAVVEGLAYNIVQGTAPGSLLGKRVVQLEIGTLVAGTSLRGQFEERVVGIVDEARHSPNIILFIDEIHTIVGAGDTIDSNLDAANILKPALSRGEIVCIGATTNEEYRKAIAQDAALDRRFRTIPIEEPSPEDTLTILTNLQGHYSKHHNVEIRPEALQAAVSLSSKYMIDRRQPDKALDLLDEACARLVIQTGPLVEGGAQRVVTAETVAEVLSEWTGIPIAELSEDERRKYQRMESALSGRVIGQDHAIRAVADAIKTNRAGLSDPSRPVGVFLFVGPSGVGKTELAKALATFLFGDEDALIRLDMSEFHDEHTVARLIGSPPGYKDSQRGGQLTEALRRKPYSVVLLDEVEKAAPEVFDIFLQVFDDGRLTDSRGTTFDARHAVWIMTSNIGTAEGGKALGFRGDSSEGSMNYRAPSYANILKKFFRPEFLNRLDDVIVFNPLGEKVLIDILDLQLTDIRARLSKQKLTLQLDQSACDLILSQGYDPANGARPLRRAIERLLTRPLSQAILNNNYPANSTIVAKAAGDVLKFETEGHQAVATTEA